MRIATIALDYDGRAWVASLDTPAGSPVGLCHLHRTLTTLAPDLADMDKTTAEQIATDLGDHVATLMLHVRQDLSDPDGKTDVPLF